MALEGYKYNFREITRGDTYKGALLTATNKTLGQPIDITGCIIRMQLRKAGQAAAPVAIELSTTNALIEITDGPAGKFKINPFKMEVLHGLYNYDIEFTYPGDTVQTYVFGQWLVKEDTTK